MCEIWQNRLFESFANNWSTMQKTRPQQKFSLSIRNSLSFQFFLFAKGFNELHNWQGTSIMEWETEVVSPIYFSHHSCYFNSTRALITQQMTLKTQLFMLICFPLLSSYVKFFETFCKSSAKKSEMVDR